MAMTPSYIPATVKPPLRDTLTKPCCPAFSCRVGGEMATTSVGSWSGEAESGINEILKAPAALPVLVMVNLIVCRLDPGPTAPNDTVGGWAVAPGDNAAAAFSFPAPTDAISSSPELELSPISLGLTLALFTRADLIWAGEKPGLACLTRAAAPATMAAAKLDPSTTV